MFGLMLLPIKSMNRILLAVLLLSLCIGVLADWSKGCPIQQGDEALANTMHENNKYLKTHWIANEKCRSLIDGEAEPQNLIQPGNSSCFGHEVLYNHTVSNLLELPQFKTIENFPRCWSAVAPFICALKFRPTEIKTGCSKANLLLKRYTFKQLWPKSICFDIRKACSDVIEHNMLLDQLLNCEDTSLFSNKCDNKYNTTESFEFTSDCMSSMVKLNYSSVDSAFNVDVCHLSCDSAFASDEKNRLAIFRQTSLATCSMFMATFIFVMFFSVKTNQPLTTVIALCCLIFYFAIWTVSLFFNMTEQRSTTCKSFDGVLIRTDNNGVFTWCSIQAFMLNFFEVQFLIMLMLGIVLKGHEGKKKVTFCKRLTFETCRLFGVLFLVSISILICYWTIPIHTDGILNVCTTSVNNSYFLLYGFCGVISVLIVGAHLMENSTGVTKVLSMEPLLEPSLQKANNGIKFVSKKKFKFFAVVLLLIIKLSNGLLHCVFTFTPQFEHQKLREKISCLTTQNDSSPPDSCQMPKVDSVAYVQLWLMLFLIPLSSSLLLIAILWEFGIQKSCELVENELEHVEVQSTGEGDSQHQKKNLSLLNDNSQNQTESWINDHFDATSSVPESAAQLNNRGKLWFEDPICKVLLSQRFNGQANSQPNFMPPFPADGSNSNAYVYSPQTNQNQNLINDEQNFSSSGSSRTITSAAQSSIATSSDPPTSTASSDPLHIAKDSYAMGLAYNFAVCTGFDPTTFMGMFDSPFQVAFTTFLHGNYPEFLGTFTHFNPHVASVSFAHKGQLQSDQLTRLVADVISRMPINDIPRV